MPDSKSVQLERYFSALPLTVWRGWTEPEMVSRWFGSDPAGKVLAVQLDVRPSGRFEVTFRDSSGIEHTCGGVYVDVMPESKLSFSWHWRSEPGIQSFVTVQLKPHGEGTNMHFEHSHLIDGSTHDYAAGWRRTFEKLAIVLSERT
jgi:uncharacterized protein YndB with AHSA1/START domain